MVLRVFFTLKRNFSLPIPLIKRLKEIRSDEQIKNHLIKITNSNDLIENIRSSFYLSKSDASFPIQSYIPYFQPKFNKVFSDMSKLESKEIGALVYIIKTARELKVNLICSKENEIELLKRIDDLVDENIELSKLTSIFRDIILAEKISRKLEKKLLMELLDKNNDIPMEDIRRILIATTTCPKDRFREIETQVLNRLEILNLDLSILKQLSDGLKFAGLIGTRRDCENVTYLIKLNLSIRRKTFDVKDIRNIVEYYCLNIDQDYSLLYDSLYRLEKIIDHKENTIESEISLIIQGLKKLMKIKPDLRIKPQFYEKMIEFVVSLNKDSKFGLVRTFDCLSDLSDVISSPSSKIKEFIEDYRDNTTSGYWQFAYLKLLSHYESLDDADFKSLVARNQHILEYNMGTKLRILNKIFETKGYKKNPHLKSFSDSIINHLIQSSTSHIKVANICPYIHETKDLMDIESYTKLIKTIFQTLTIPDPMNGAYFDFKYTIPYLNQNDLILEEWKRFIKLKMNVKIENIIPSLIMDFQPKHNLKPFLYLVSICQSNRNVCIAKILSIKSSSFTSDDLAEAFEMLKTSGPSALLNSAFIYSKGSMAHHIFEKISNNDTIFFIKRAKRIISSCEFNPVRCFHLAKLLGNLKLLDEDNAKNIAKIFQSSKDLENLEDLVLEYSNFVNLFQENGIQDYLIVDQSITFSNLLKRLDAYLSWDNQLVSNEKLLSFIKEKLGQSENKSFAPNLIKILAKKQYHNAFREELILFAISLMEMEPQKFPNYKILDSLYYIMRGNLNNDEIIGRMEPMVFSDNLSNSFGIKLIKAYAESNRINDYFTALCRQIEPDYALAFESELRSLGPVDNAAFNNLLSAIDSINRL